MIYAIVSIKNGTLSIHENAFFKGAGTVFQACKKGGFFEKNGVMGWWGDGMMEYWGIGDA